MKPENAEKLRQRVMRAAESALEKQGYVSAIDVLSGIGWLDPATLKRWRLGQLACLEMGMQAGLPRISEAMRQFRDWAGERQLRPSETAYVARTPARPHLRFSVSGSERIEQHYRTHWVSTALSAQKRARIEAKASKPPDLVVIHALKPDWRCHRCGGGGGFLIMEDPGPACLACAGLDGLVFLPAGDAALTRRAKAGSRRHAVVVRFSRTRKRYERQGLLVEPEALTAAEQ